MRALLRILGGILAVVVFLGVVIVLNVMLAMRAVSQTSGTIAGTGVQAPVEILRDERGIPHIRAKNEHDLFFAQGYAEAQDRAFQMDLLRRFVYGTLAEVMGAAALPTDEKARIVPVKRLVDEQWKRLSAQQQADFTAFAEGANAALTREPRAVEFNLLRYTPEPWRPQDSLAVGFATVLDLADGWNDIADRIGRKVAITDPCFDAPVTDGLAKIADPAKCNLRAALLPLLTDTRAPIGSNNWASGAAHNVTGRALVANDPHLRLQIPGTWYLVDLSAPGYHVAGAVLAGIPGVILGHNDRIAWGATNGTTTAMSLFEAPNYATLPKETETFHVRFGSDQTLRYYRGKREFGVPAAVRGKTRYYLARWQAYADPVSPIQTFDGLDRATSIEDATKALRSYPGPTQNFVVGDTTGRVFYHLAGAIPNDPLWGNAIHPASDLRKTYASLSFDQLPHVSPSRAGVVWTSNNRMYGPGYPYQLSGQFSAPYRAHRVAEMLRARSHYDVEYFTTIQMDTLSVGEKKLASFFPSLQSWDGRFTPDSTQATAIYHIRRSLVKTYATFSDTMNVVGADPHVLAKVTPEPSPARWGTAGAVTVPHPLAALGMRFLNGTTFTGDGDAYTVRVQNNGTSQSFRAVWDVGNWDAGGMIVPQGESGQPGSKHYTDQAAAWSAGKLPAIPFSDAAVTAATVDHLTLLP